MQKYRLIITFLVFLSSTLYSTLSLADRLITEKNDVTKNTSDNKNNIQSLDLKDLMDIQVTSVAKKQQSLSNSAAAIFVITQQDIERSGATSIPEALRMAPGINVARIDSNKWAITSRGFNGRFANKLLVMIDGRTVYTPSYSGVYWEVQDTLMEDIERIEVIRGPGATLWGANAVNGVINIITKNSIETQGGLVSLGSGDQEQAFAGFRYGAKLDEQTHARAYIKGFKRDEFNFKKGGDANDEWEMLQTGTRMDSQISNRNSLTLQADYYHGKVQDNQSIPLLEPPFYETANKKTDVNGGNIMARWQHTESLTSEFSLQLYYDYTHREENYTNISNNVFDIDFQHRFSPLETHDVVWGVGYRYTNDDFQRFPGFIKPRKSTLELFNAFLQDEINLIDNTLWLTLGSKFEHNRYTDWEIQPSARLFWNLHPRHKLWAAFSKAVRTPSRYEHNSSILHGVLPPGTGFNSSGDYTGYIIQGNPGFDSEKVYSYEIGYRMSPMNQITFDSTVFYNDYKDLQGYEFGTPQNINSIVVYPVPIANNRKGHTSGLELASNWQVKQWWSMDLAYTYFYENIKTSSYDVLVSADPENIVSLRSNMNLNHKMDLDLWLKYVDSSQVLNHIGELTTIKAYTTLDARIAWKPRAQLTLSLVGQNLLDSEHVEYIDAGIFDSVEIERGVYFKILWDF